MDSTVNSPAEQYTAIVASPILNGEARLVIDENELRIVALFGIVPVPYSKIISLTMVNYMVIVKTDSEDYIFSQLGRQCLPFFNTLSEAYNKAVVRALFIKGTPSPIVKGNYSFIEGDISSNGSASIQVYENCIASLPSNLDARRIPLCFVTGMEKKDFELILKLDTNNSYSFSKLGYDTAPFTEAVEKNIRRIREDTLSAVMEIDPSLTPLQASELSRITSLRATASLGQLTSIAPSFKKALETKLNTSHAKETYSIFKELCDPSNIWVGFRKNENTNEEVSNESIEGDSSKEIEETVPEPYLFWFIVPSPNLMYAAVEFAEADSATFIYRTEGNFVDFAKQLNHALEAIDFKREVIRLSDKELLLSENVNYLMASKRTAALQFIRSRFHGRIIHSNINSWKQNLLKKWGIEETTTIPYQEEISEVNTIRIQKEVPQPVVKYCSQCGTVIKVGAMFCSNCGAKL